MKLELFQKPLLQLTEPINSCILFNTANGAEIARIDDSGIFSFSMDATDENTRQFVDCLEKLTGRKIAGAMAKQVVTSKGLDRIAELGNQSERAAATLAAFGNAGHALLDEVEGRHRELTKGGQP
jgi:hypothetical protein